MPWKSLPQVTRKLLRPRSKRVETSRKSMLDGPDTTGLHNLNLIIRPNSATCSGSQACFSFQQMTTLRPSNYQTHFSQSGPSFLPTSSQFLGPRTLSHKILFGSLAGRGTSPQYWKKLRQSSSHKGVLNGGQVGPPLCNSWIYYLPRSSCSESRTTTSYVIGAYVLLSDRNRKP